MTMPMGLLLLMIVQNLHVTDTCTKTTTSTTTTTTACNANCPTGTTVGTDILGGTSPDVIALAIPLDTQIITCSGTGVATNQIVTIRCVNSGASDDKVAFGTTSVSNNDAAVTLQCTSTGWLLVATNQLITAQGQINCVN